MLWQKIQHFLKRCLFDLDACFRLWPHTWDFSELYHWPHTALQPFWVHADVVLFCTGWLQYTLFQLMSHVLLVKLHQKMSYLKRGELLTNQTAAVCQLSYCFFYLLIVYKIDQMSCADNLLRVIKINCCNHVDIILCSFWLFLQFCVWSCFVSCWDESVSELFTALWSVVKEILLKVVCVLASL